MILRKPYAFLIKYFKIIHILMFVLFTYLVFALRKIFVFFSEYIQTNNFVYRLDITSYYVPGLLFFIVLMLLALAISILFLMRKKEKPVLFYRIMIGYTIALLIVLIYFTTFFNSLDKATYEPLRIVVNRDISLFFYLFNFFFVLFSFIRGFGFDIKKFSFEKDKKELHLEESDSEEYELNVGVEKADVKTFFNKHKRELKYYVKENVLVLSIVAAVLLIVGVIYAYNYFFVDNWVYKENSNINIGSLVYRVNSSMISNYDKYGQEIGTDDEYLIVNVNIINNAATGALSAQSLRVNLDNDYYYLSTPSCDLFSDLGTCYKYQELKTGIDNNYILVFKVKKGHDKAYLEILKNKNDYDYARVALLYTRDKLVDIETNAKEFTINDNKYQINNFEVANKMSYQYKECANNNCDTYKKIVSPSIGEVVMALEIEELDTLSQDFLNSAIGIENNNTIYNGKAIRLLDIHENTVYYSIPNFNNNSFTLLVTTRGVRYKIMLGGETNE